MADYLLDSCVLIRHLRKHLPTVELVERLVLESDVSIATMTRVELIEGMRDHERDKTMLLLDSLPAHPLDSPIADLAGEFIRRYRRQGVTLDRPDAVIGATAAHRRLVLVTYNGAHFPMPEITRYSPMPAWP